MNGHAYSSFGHYNWAYGQEENTAAFDGVARRENGVNAHARTVAQERRRLENSEFQRLSALLPVAQAIAAKHLDKATVIRLASVYIRLNNAVAEWKSTRSSFFGPLIENNVVNMLDGFLLCLSLDATVLYVELCGSSFFDYVHPADVSFGRHRLAQFQEGALPELFLNLRIKSTLTKRRNRESPNCAAGYKVVSIELNNRVSGSFFAFCQPHSSRISNGIRLTHNQVLLGLDLSFAIVYVDYQNPLYSKLRVGCSFYHCVHPDDLHSVLEMHHQLRVLGSHRTPFVRLLIGNREVQTEMIATLYSNPQKRALNSNGGGHSSRISLIVTMLG